MEHWGLLLGLGGPGRNTQQTLIISVHLFSDAWPEIRVLQADREAYLHPIGLFAFCTWAVQHIPWNVSDGVIQESHAPQDTYHHGDQEVSHSYLSVAVSVR